MANGEDSQFGVALPKEEFWKEANVQRMETDAEDTEDEEREKDKNPTRYTMVRDRYLQLVEIKAMGFMEIVLSFKVQVIK